MNNLSISTPLHQTKRKSKVRPPKSLKSSSFSKKEKLQIQTQLLENNRKVEVGRKDSNSKDNHDGILQEKHEISIKDPKTIQTRAQAQKPTADFNPIELFCQKMKGNYSYF